MPDNLGFSMTINAIARGPEGYLPVSYTLDHKLPFSCEQLGEWLEYLALQDDDWAYRFVDCEGAEPSADEVAHNLRQLAARSRGVYRLTLVTRVERDYRGLSVGHVALVWVDLRRRTGRWVDSTHEGPTPDQIRDPVMGMFGLERWICRQSRQQAHGLTCCAWAADNIQRLLRGFNPYKPENDDDGIRYIANWIDSVEI